MEAPQSGAKLPPVYVSLPNGTVVRSDAPGADQALSAHFKRNVTLIQTAPDDFVIDAYLPNIEGATPAGMGDTTVPVKLGAALFAKLGIGSPIPAGSFFDVFPITLLTSSTLDHLSNQQLESRFDVRRFRMNVIVATSSGGFIENDWVGGTLQVGETAHLSITMNDPRCVMVTLDQADLPKDTDILRALVRENMREVATMGTLPCAGVYAAVATPGTIRVGDVVALI